MFRVLSHTGTHYSAKTLDPLGQCGFNAIRIVRVESASHCGLKIVEVWKVLSEIMTHLAMTSILAWAAVTLSHLQLTVDPGVARPTGAGVTALTCIHTCGSIHTWFVVCAKIQICFERNHNICQH